MTRSFIGDGVAVVMLRDGTGFYMPVTVTDVSVSSFPGGPTLVRELKMVSHKSVVPVLSVSELYAMSKPGPWRCPYCEHLNNAVSDICLCGAVRPFVTLDG